MQNRDKSDMRVYLEVQLDAIAHNIKQMKVNLNADTGIWAVVKADGYGHGSYEIAKHLAKKQLVAGFAVATYDEAEEIRCVTQELPILILGHTFPCDYEAMIAHEIRPTIYRLDTAQTLSEIAQRLQKTVHIHIKVDTGMSRIGIFPNAEGLHFISQIMKLPFIEVEGIFTHFATADEANKEKTEIQYKEFLNFIEKIEALDLHIPWKHCSNSAAIIELPHMQLDMVRAGISMYGIEPSDEMNCDALELIPALSWYSQVVLVKTVKKGTSISYGGMFTATKDIKVATIPIGYADGYPRSLSNKGAVLINGKRCNILGKVCMDQFMVDVTHLEAVGEGDKVTLIGKDGDEVITTMELGKESGRFHYELLTVISKRVPRLYI